MHRPINKLGWSDWWINLIYPEIWWDARGVSEIVYTPPNGMFPNESIMGSACGFCNMAERQRYGQGIPPIIFQPCACIIVSVLETDVYRIYILAAILSVVSPCMVRISYIGSYFSIYTDIPYIYMIVCSTISVYYRHSYHLWKSASHMCIIVYVYRHSCFICSIYQQIIHRCFPKYHDYNIPWFHNDYNHGIPY